MGKAVTVPRRRVLQLGAAATALSATTRIGWAQTYPARPITLVAPIAAGGGVDTAARIIAEKLQEQLRQSVVVENRPGAGSVIGTSFVAKAPRDGYTLLLMEPGAVLAKWLSKTAPFDVTSDFSPIARVAVSSLVLFAHPSLGFHDLRELIGFSKANPRKLSVGTPGVGTPHHLAAAWLNAAAKIDITHVPYRGSAPALNDLLGGQIPLIWATPVAVMPFVAQDKVRALAVSTHQRDPLLAQVPTVSESGVAGFDITIWFGVVAPADVPSEVIVRIGEAVRASAELPDVQQRMSALGYTLDYRSSDPFREMIMSEHNKYGKIIREAGIQGD